MKAAVFWGALGAAVLSASLVSAGTLEDVRANKKLTCGVNTSLAGFAAPDANERWKGFDVDYCRALAAVVLGDGEAVEFKPLTNRGRFDALFGGDVDVLVGNTAWTFNSDVTQNLTFVGVSLYDGQGFMVPKELGISSAKDLDRKRVCIEDGTVTAQNLGDFFRANNIGYEPVAVTSNADAQEKYVANECDVYTTYISSLAATRATFEDADAHTILPEMISKDPLGPMVRQDDIQWADIASWTLKALIAAEELGVTSTNLEQLAEGASNPEINRLLGTEGEFGKALGLDADWAVRAIAAGGNYGEVFEKNIGEATTIGLARGLNAQWTQGGLLYAPPFR